jgi:hypothetical protein
MRLKMLHSHWHFSHLSYFDELLSFSKPMKEIFKDKKERQLRNYMTDTPLTKLKRDISQERDPSDKAVGEKIE